MNLEISTVVGCKMNCDYCPQKVHVKTYTDKTRETVMSLDNFKTILSTVPKECEIIFAGMAEPWLNKSCTDMVEYAFEQGYKVGVYTTLSGMTMTDVIRIHDLPFIHFTLHLPDEGGRMRLEPDEKYMQVLRKVLEVLDVQLMCIGQVHPKVKEYTGEIIDGSQGLISRGGLLKLTPRKQGKIRCSAMGPKMDQNIVLPNGDVLICCCDYSQKHVIGNLMYMNYEDLYTSPEYLRIKEGLEDDTKEIICRNCELSVQT